MAGPRLLSLNGMSAVGRMKTWIASRRMPLFDALSSAMLVAVAAGMIGVTGSYDEPGLLFATSSPTGAILWTLPYLVPLALRRVKPEPAAWMFVALTATHLIFGPATAYSDLYAPLMLYSALVYGEHRHTRRFIAAAVTMCVLGALVWSWTDTLETGRLETDVFAIFITASGICVCAVIIMAFWQRARRATVIAMRERNALIAARTQDERRIAAEAERARIARDMHDVVAHTLSTIIVQSDGGRYAGAHDPDLARRTMTTIRTEAQRAQHDMANLFDIFSDSGNAGYAGLDALIRHAQLPVTRHIVGTVRAQLLRGQGDEAVFRLVQESLSNARKYAGAGAHVTITETWSDDALRITVSDDGQGADACRDGHAPGYGLIGMRERVEAAGGTLTAGPQPAGGFIVQAELPLRAIRTHSPISAPQAFTTQWHDMADRLHSKPMRQNGTAKADRADRIAALSLWCERHYLLTDMLIALVLVIVCTPTTLSELTAARPELGEGTSRQFIATLITVAGLLPVAFRRRFPETSALAVAMLALLQLLFSPSILLFIDVFALMFVYSAVLYGRDNAWRWVSVALVVDSWLAGIRLMGGLRQQNSMFQLLFAHHAAPDTLMLIITALFPAMLIMIAGFGCIALARWKRSDGSNALVLRQREEALRAEEERQKVLAANLERNRIAAAMQEDVTATLSTVIERTDNGLALLDGSRTRPDARDIADAFAAIGEQGRRSLAHMRQLLSVLRETGFSDDSRDDASMRLEPAARLHEQMQSLRMRGMSHDDGNVS